MCRSNKTADSVERTVDSKRKLHPESYTPNAKKAFSLIEVVAALAILALASSSVLVVINRCITSAADSALRMEAFEVARNNMETLLASDSVKEMVEYGSSNEYPQVQWQTTVEAFYEPLTERMWIRAICAAEYTDSEGEAQTVELTHWLTDLTKNQVLQMIKQMAEEWSTEQLIEMPEEAADYAGVDVETIQQWVENGMAMTEDDYYIKSELDLYRRSDGKPTIEDKRRQEAGEETQGEQTEQGEADETTPTDTESNPANPFGLPDGYEDWSIDEILQWLRDNGLF